MTTQNATERPSLRELARRIEATGISRYGRCRVATGAAGPAPAGPPPPTPW